MDLELRGKICFMLFIFNRILNNVLEVTNKDFEKINRYKSHSIKILIGIWGNSINFNFWANSSYVFPCSNRSSQQIRSSVGCFIYILDSSNSSLFSFWSSQLASCSRSNWTGVWNGNSNGTWTDKQSSHFSTAKEISVKATFFFM